MTMTIIPNYVLHSVLCPISFSRQNHNRIVNNNIKYIALPVIGKHENIYTQWIKKKKGECWNAHLYKKLAPLF